MKTSAIGISFLTAVAFLLLAGPARALGPGFTYQGQLQQNGAPYTGACDFHFSLWDALSSGTPSGSAQIENSVPVTGGVFTVELNDSGEFGATPFPGTDRWLQIGVSCPASGAPNFTVLTPRQKLTAEPYAHFAANIPDGIVTTSKLDGLAVGNEQLGDSSVTSTKIQDGSVAPVDLSFNYAGSTSKGGPASDVSFNYAASSSKGGPATDVSCVACVDAADLNVPLALTSGTVGPVLSGSTTSTTASAVGVKGTVNTTSPGGSSVAVYGENKGTNANGYGVRGSQAGGGTGVWGSSKSGEGVYGSSDTGNGVLAYSDGGIALKIRANTGNLIEAFETARPDVRRFYLDVSGNVYADGSYNCGKASACFNTGVGADLAERIDPMESLRPGDLVEIDPDNADRFRLSRSAYSHLVAGVVSTNPGVTMNNNDLQDNDTGLRTDTRPLLALVGKVPVKVTAENGPVRPGDLLVASGTPGHAMKAGADAAPGTIVGKALESLDGGSGVVKMLVMLR